MKLCVLILSIYTIISVKSNLTLEYYEQLINQSITNAIKYKLPTDNSKFDNGFKSNTLIDAGTFDFIIIGAGSAGSVLATRLSEISEWNVLLLEAGGEENDLCSIPGMSFYCQFTDFNWGYYTTPQKHCCLGMKNHKCIAPRGKVLGGSSVINALAYIRGNKNDYDKWAEMGNVGWSYEEVLPYFLKSENSQIDGDPGYHGKGGFWNVEYSPVLSDFVQYFIDANAELNRPNIDYNGQSQLGVSRIQQNVKHGKRQSTGTAFLNNARKRKNLKIITEAFVTKIIIDSSLKIALGVEFVTKNQKYQAYASKEVILSAGAINSPQILMLSGIGPKNYLQKFNIKLVQDLPVGENLYDHALFYGINFRTNYTNPQSTLTEDIEQFLQGTGPLTVSTSSQAVGFWGSKNVPEIEYLLVPPSSINSKISNRASNYNDETAKNFSSHINPITDISISTVLLHPKSKGRVTLKSANPVDFPEIDSNLLSESSDIDTFIKGLKHVLELLQTKPFKKINATFLNINICQEFKAFSKNFWKCALRQLSATTYHVCGTTRMGPNKRTSVVDNNLKIHGIKRIRVVDAGVIPRTVSGHTSAAVVMIAEKISDVIKKDYGKFIEQCKVN